MNNYLEELIVPQPPYRMARPVARLTAGTGEPFNGIRIAEKRSQQEAQETPEPSIEEKQEREFFTHIAKAELPESALPEQQAKLTELKEELSQRARALRPPTPTPVRGERVYKVGDTYHRGQVEAKVLEVNKEGRPTALETEEKVKPAPIEVHAAKEPTADEHLREIRDKQTKLREAGKTDEAKTWDETAKKYEDWIKEHVVVEPAEPPVDVGSQTVYVRQEKKPKRSKGEELPANRRLLGDRWEASGERVETGHGAGLEQKEWVDFERAKNEFSEAAEHVMADPEKFEKAKAAFEKAIAIWTESQKPKAPEKINDFREAKSFDELNEALRVMKPEGLIGHVTDVRDVFHKVAHGNINAPVMRLMLNELRVVDDLEEKVVKLLQKEKEQNLDFRAVKSFDELDEVLRTKKVIQGSRESFAGEDQADRVASARRMFRMANGSINSEPMRLVLNKISRAGGLREKVIELLKQEKAA